MKTIWRLSKEAARYKGYYVGAILARAVRLICVI